MKEWHGVVLIATLGTMTYCFGYYSGLITTDTAAGCVWHMRIQRVCRSELDSVIGSSCTGRDHDERWHHGKQLVIHNVVQLT
jgi:hypothetical protein